MKIRQISDDFFTVGNIAVLYKTTGNEVYDFDFRSHFECKSVTSVIEQPIVLHIGAVKDYAALEEMIGGMGMKLLINVEEHLRCSTIDKWYPLLKVKTPYTEIYDTFPAVKEVMKHFTFPVFIKGNRQTNRHNKSQCIIEKAEDYEKLKESWKRDNVLSWQKVAIREFVPLQTVDKDTYADMVPISYEFRFFFFEGKCVGYGPYWYMGNKYAMNPEDYDTAISLAEWAAEKVGVPFIAVDLAKTAKGEWIVIEVNDAQESGFVGLNSLALWHKAIEAMQSIK